MSEATPIRDPTGGVDLSLDVTEVDDGDAPVVTSLASVGPPLSARIVSRVNSEKENNRHLKETIRIRSESVRQLVHEKPEVEVSFENLSVNVPARKSSGFVKMAGCFSSVVIERFGTEYLGTTSTIDEPMTVLSDVSGIVRTGEMLLVLGTVPEISSVLIRTLTGRMTARDAELSGTLRVNGSVLNRSDWQGWRRVAPYVSATDTSHTAVLTVRETFEFAAKCGTAASRIPHDASSPLSFQEKVNETVNEILRVLDLEHVADTVVGDENVRGISGGQKRRVTVGEMLLNSSTLFLGLEQITDGLSSADSYNLISRLSRICKTFRIAAVVSLLQPGDEVVFLFDKLLVLSSRGGSVDYCGPISRTILKQVFTGTSKNDSFCEAPIPSGSICDLILDPPESATYEFGARYRETVAYADMVRSLNDIRSSTVSSARELKKVLPQTKYSLKWQQQFRVLAARRLKLIVRNAVTYTRIAIAVIFGCIVGSLFSALQNDIVGCLSRTGYMFLHCFLVLMLSAAITIPQTFRERVTLYKHRSAEFYSSRISYMTQLVLDLPMAVLEAVLLSSISYFWVGMKPGAAAFFYFVSVLVGLEFVGQALGRLLCAISSKQVLANTLSSITILLFGTVAGFMPGYPSIPPIFRWMSWVTPVSYAFEGLMLNEFAGRNFTGFVLVTSDGTTDLGSFSGSLWLEATGLPRENWTSLTGIKVFDVIFLFFLSFLYDLLGCYFVEKKRDYYFNQSRRPQRVTESTTFAPKGTSEVESGNEDHSSVSVNKVAHDWPNCLTIKDLSYYVPLPKKRDPLRFSVQPLLSRVIVGSLHGSVDETAPEGKHDLRLLNSIDAVFRRGRMVALTGASGCGKSTLLDVVSGYKTAGRIVGEVRIDGRIKDPVIWKRISAYAEQSDILNPYLSAMETLRFTAACRLSDAVDNESVIQEVIDLMELNEYAKMVIGREAEGEGLPKHARKRLTIAIQLVTMPRILFADEPTTGLGTVAANIVVKALRRCTDRLNLITVATIHQPSKLIWDAFDDLLLLAKGGNLVYMGEMGQNSESVLNYFSRLSGMEPLSHVNPADYVLSAAGNVSDEKATSAFRESEMYEDIIRTIKSETSREHEHNATLEATQHIHGETVRRSIVYKYILLVKRHYTTQWRNPSYSLLRLVSSFLIPFYLGILFSGDKSSLQSAVFSIGAIFFLVFVLVIPMQSSVVPLVDDRAVLYRESASGLYSRLIYGIGQFTADVPFHLLNCLLMFVSFYFIVGFQIEGDLIGYFILMVFLSNWAVMCLGQFFALASPNEESATGLAGLSVILSVILMGFLITVNSMPSGWTWAYWSNLFRYIVQGLVTNELAGQDYNVPLATVGELIPIGRNTTNAIVFPPSADISWSSSAARQAANFFALAIEAGPGTNYNWNASGIVAVGSLLRCMVENECLTEPLLENFIECNIFKGPCRPPCRPPCQSEFRQAMDTVNVSAAISCLSPEISNATFTDATATEELVNGLESAQLGDLDSQAKLRVVLCVLRALLPPGALDALIHHLLLLFEKALKIVAFVINILENGVTIPAELILWVFGWAEIQGGELVAPFKWYYCLFAVAMFLIGLQFLQVLALCFVVWTKR